MKQLLLIAVALVVVGCGGAPQAPGSGGGASQPAASVAKPLKKLVTCSSYGVDGYLVPYRVQYTLKTFADGSQEASCSVVQGTVGGLRCPSDQPLSLTYSITGVYSHAGQPTPYTNWINQTFNETSSDCAVANL